MSAPGELLHTSQSARSKASPPLALTARFAPLRAPRFAALQNARQLALPIGLRYGRAKMIAAIAANSSRRLLLCAVAGHPQTVIFGQVAISPGRLAPPACSNPIARRYRESDRSRGLSPFLRCKADRPVNGFPRNTQREDGRPSSRWERIGCMLAGNCGYGYCTASPPSRLPRAPQTP